MIESADGVWLADTEGRRYIDGISSLWCNVHGHRHPGIDAAVRAQLDRVAHTHDARPLAPGRGGAGAAAGRRLARRAARCSRVFYSDSGSTAVEVALKMAFQYWQQAPDARPARTGFVCLEDAYHGDTVGSVSVGGIDLFHSHVPAAAVRLPPGAGRGRGRARACAARKHGDEIAAVVVEPLVQGAAGMLAAAAGLPAGGARACATARRVPGLRRGRDRLRPHRAHVRVRARGRRARLPVPRQGADGRLPAARRDAYDGTGLRRVPGPTTRTSAPSSTVTPTPATRSPARPRSRRSTCSRRSARSSGCSRSIALLEQLLTRAGRAAPARRGGAPARLHVRHRAGRPGDSSPRRAWVTA